MQIIEQPHAIIHPGLVAGIGFFDGVHLGHRSLIANIISKAEERQMASAVITFRTHPREVLHSDYCPQLINTFEEKIEHLSQTGLNYCIVLDFTPEMSQMSALDFIRFLIDNYSLKCLFIGYDHRFGHNRLEGFEDYVNYGKELHIDVLQAEMCMPEGKHVSSSTIRQLISEGNVSEAARLLTYPYTLQGQVVSGHQIGRKIGFPTANIEINNPHKIVPAHGVYAVRIKINGDKSYNGMVNIGKRPTVHTDGETCIEAHLFDFSGNLYGQNIEIQFIAHLRSEQKMNGLEELTAQLQKDKEHAISTLLRSSIPF
ncbi:bifunctional riboflavin kinase/FAD synthetase [Coprobacter sp.]